MKTYIGTKLIKAEPMNRGKFNSTKRVFIPTNDANYNDAGYKVVYPDGYESWSPKDVFEKAYHDASDMLVFKEDAIARKNDDNTLTPYEVVCADENVFVIAPITLNDDDSCTTDYGELAAYSNERSINTLEDLGFVKLEDK